MSGVVVVLAAGVDDAAADVVATGDDSALNVDQQ